MASDPLDTAQLETACVRQSCHHVHPEINRKGIAVRLEEQEVTIQHMVNDCSSEDQRVDAVLKTWRDKLEKEPTLLQPFQIDKIVREVRHRLNDIERA